MRRASSLQRGSLLGVASFLALAIGWAEPRADSPPAERYAHRVVPYLEGWTTESTIPARKQGIWEISHFAPGSEPTVEQRRAAEALVERSFAAAKKHGWHDVAKARADGFVLPPHDPHHYGHNAYKLDDHVLDPDRPEYLMYYGHEGKLYLTGMMFIPRTREEQGLQIGGPLTLWHYHTWRRAQCTTDELIPQGWASKDGRCEEGIPKYRSPEMIHVWLIDRNEGPFTTSMIIPPEELKTGLEKRLAERGY